jgi:hypothetical protein
MLNRSKLLAVSLLIAVFVAGGAVGGVVVATWGDSTQGRQVPPRPRRSYTDFLTQELKLSDVQHDSVQAIVSRRDTAMRALWQEVGPKFDTLRSQVRAEIMRVLNDEQRAAYESLIQASERRRPDRGEHESR